MPGPPPADSGLLLHIIARGKIGRSPEAELVDRYLKRIAWPIKVTEIAERAAAPSGTVRGVKTVVLDERGKTMSSADFARRIDRWRDQGIRETRFLIGAADGHGEVERNGADLLLSFGPATWPHLMARAMLAEQLFRATSLLANHPYHRDG